MRIALATLALTLLGAACAQAQSAATYRVQVTTEATGNRDNPASPLVRPDGNAWTVRGLFVALGSGAWEGGRLKMAAGAALTATGGELALRTREAYARVSATSWMDVEAGKRLVRWGVGYGFSPAGVLDPPRIATDPTDRLGLNEGRPMARVDVFRGDSSLTVAAASSSRLVAARLRTVLPGGVEVAATPRRWSTMTTTVGLPARGRSAPPPVCSTRSAPARTSSWSTIATEMGSMATNGTPCCAVCGRPERLPDGGSSCSSVRHAPRRVRWRPK
jgi:hypothetical protein